MKRGHKIVSLLIACAMVTPLAFSNVNTVEGPINLKVRKQSIISFVHLRHLHVQIRILVKSLINT